MARDSDACCYEGGRTQPTRATHASLWSQQECVGGYSVYSARRAAAQLVPGAQARALPSLVGALSSISALALASCAGRTFMAVQRIQWLPVDASRAALACGHHVYEVDVDVEWLAQRPEDRVRDVGRLERGDSVVHRARPRAVAQPHLGKLCALTHLQGGRRASGAASGAARERISRTSPGATTVARTPWSYVS